MENGGWVYDARLDRYDVAIRALARLCQGRVQGSKKYLARLGISPAQAQAVQDALLKVESIKSEDGIFALLVECPFLLWAAVELLGMYQQKFGLTRGFHYAQRGARR
jgi:hypothetical protein